MMNPVRFPELGIYLLPGHSARPADLLDEVRAAEALGLGSAWISERFDVKEVGALAGAAAAVTERIWIGTGVTNVDTRHPLVLASLATTVNRLSGGRFALGIGRGIKIRSTMLGLSPVSNRKLADFTALMRRLWSGEHVMGHESTLGSFPYLHQASWLNERIPLLMAAFGERSLEFAGSVFDGVILHTFLSDDALARAVALVRRGAEKAGRDPASVRVWSVLAVACDAPEERQLKLIPAEWLPAAIGSSAQCARRIEDQFAAGADGVILHASLPHEAAPAIEAYAQQRGAARGVDGTGRPA